MSKENDNNLIKTLINRFINPIDIVHTCPELVLYMCKILPSKTHGCPKCLTRQMWFYGQNF